MSAPAQERRRPRPTYRTRPVQPTRPMCAARQPARPAQPMRPVQPMRPAPGAAVRRKRDLSQEQLQRRQERRERRAMLEAESRELAKGPIDMPFFLLVVLLTGIGLVMLFSASFARAYYSAATNHNPFYYLIRQGIFAAMGFAAMLIVAKINYQRFRALAKPLLMASIILLVLVILPGPNKYGKLFGITLNRATRWLGIPGTELTFQPSEIAKFAVVLYFSDTISRKKDLMRTFRYGILPYAMLLAVISLLMMKEPHLSGMLLILGAGGILMLAGGIQWRWVFAAVGGVAAAAYTILFVIGYNASRIEMWLDPWKDASDDGYQMVQSLYAIGSGGLLGVGLGKSREKYMYLPEERNDFIFSIVCEELGLIGAGIIMLLFAALILRGYWIALYSRDRFGSLLVIGITSLIGMQVFLNIGVVSGLLPATGVALPFFSYGGTALMIQLAEIGVVLSVSRQMKPTKGG